MSEQKFEYPYKTMDNCVLNWCTAGGRNSPESTADYLKLADATIVEDITDCWILPLSKAEVHAQLKKFRADFAANPLISPPYDPAHVPVAKDYSIVNGEPEDDENVVIPEDQPRRMAL